MALGHFKFFNLMKLTSFFTLFFFFILLLAACKVDEITDAEILSGEAEFAIPLGKIKVSQNRLEEARGIFSSYLKSVFIAFVGWKST